MFPLNAIAVSFVPSDDEVMPRQILATPIEVFSVQDRPESSEVQMFPLSTTAASFVPSDDEVMPRHSLVTPIEVFSVQFSP